MHWSSSLASVFLLLSVPKPQEHRLREQDELSEVWIAACALCREFSQSGVLKGSMG